MFKNDAVFDSINKEVNQFTDEQFENWQNSLGFVSAEKYFEPVFTEYDNLQSKQELDEFVEEYKDQICITKDDDGMYSIDYPLSNMLWLRLMNKDGVFQIGKILHSYEKNYIAVLDGDMNKLKIAKQNPEIYAGIQGENAVYIEQTPNLKSDFYNDFDTKKTYETWYNYFNDYRLTIRLECISRIMTSNTYVTLPYIWVKGEKKRTFGSGYKRIKSKFEIGMTMVEIDYPATLYCDYSLESHNIWDNNGDDYETSDKRRYGSFVFDEYIRTVTNSEQMFVLPDENRIDIQFNAGGSHWHSNTFAFGTLQGTGPWMDYQDDYPVWFTNN